MNTPNATTPASTAGLLLAASIAAALLFGYTAFEIYQTQTAQRSLESLQNQLDAQATHRRNLFDTLTSFDKLVGDSRAREDELVTELAEHQSQLELLRSKTRDLEHVSLELSRLNQAVVRYEATAREFRALVRACNTWLREPVR